jgi:UDP-N-acetylmuramoyl-tripeptide--D-alanyl-D-alanine ligase
VHLERLGSLSAIAEAKAEILEGLAPEGLLVANADDPLVVGIARRHRGRTVWFGWGPAGEVRAAAAEPLPEGEVGSRFTLTAWGASREIRLALHGLYNADNCLAAAACALALGADLDDVAAAAAAALPATGRGAVHRLPGGITLVDDSYNSSPAALERALESAAQLAAPTPDRGPLPAPRNGEAPASGGPRRWAVLGDMLELGPAAERFHLKGGEQAAALGFAPVVGVGELARELVSAAERAGASGRWFATASEAAAWAAAELRPGDLVLVKGSRGVGLEAVVARLVEAARRLAAAPGQR